MTAAEYVALARQAVQFGYQVAVVQAATKRPLVFHVYKSGTWCVMLRAGIPFDVIMHCDLTPENAASEDALVRALLASAVTSTPEAGTREPYYYTAWLGDRYKSGATKDDARNALLDALLAPTESTDYAAEVLDARLGILPEGI